MKSINEFLLGKNKKNKYFKKVDFNNFDDICTWLDSLGFKKVKKFSKETMKNKPEYKVEIHMISKHINSYFIGNDGKEYNFEFNFGHLTWARLIYFVMVNGEKRFKQMFDTWEPDKADKEDIAIEITKFIEENV